MQNCAQTWQRCHLYCIRDEAAPVRDFEGGMTEILTRVCSSCGDSLTSSARKASRTAALPTILIFFAAINMRSLKAPHVGQVFASGSEVGDKSHTPLSTA